MSTKNRFSVSFSDEEIIVLERLAIHTHKTKSEIVRNIISRYLSEKPSAFRRVTRNPIKREINIVIANNK